MYGCWACLRTAWARCAADFIVALSFWYVDIFEFLAGKIFTIRLNYIVTEYFVTAPQPKQLLPCAPTHAVIQLTLASTTLVSCVGYY